MAKRRNPEEDSETPEQDTEARGVFNKLNDNLAGEVLRESLRGGKQKPTEDTDGEAGKGAEAGKGRSKEEQESKPLNFYSTDPREEGRLRHFLRQLARICHLRGDMIPKAQESLLRKFLLNRRDRHHLQQMSNAHALRSEEALHNGNARLALLERLEAWRKMPRDLTLLLDLAEAYIEPESFTDERSQGRRAYSGVQAEQKKTDGEKPQAAAQPLAETEAKEAEQPEEEAEQKPKQKPRIKDWFGFRGIGRGTEQKTLQAERKMRKRQAAQQEKQARKKKHTARKLQEKTAQQLFQLSAWQHSRQALRYLKKAVELSVGLEMDVADGQASAAQEQIRLQKLQKSYPHINWERYTERIHKLKGQPRKRWPWVLLALLLLALLLAAYLYLPWRDWLPRWSTAATEAVPPAEPEPSEQTLLNTPVPVDWSVPVERDESFDKNIQKSQRLKLNQHYAYEVQGHIRVKPSQVVVSGGDDAESGEGPTRWQRLRPTEPFDLLLTYEHSGNKYEKRVEFSYGESKDPNESQRAPVMEGDTVLFREVFRLPDEPRSDDRLLAKIAKVGAAPQPQFVDLSQGGFAQQLNSTSISGSEVSTVGLAFRDKVQRSDGENVRMLGYDLELQNNTRQPLDELGLRLSWHQEDALTAKENAPVLLERDYNIVSDSGTNLPGLSRTTQRLWVEVPEDLSYPVEDLTPQVRVLDNRFVPAQQAAEQ